MKMQEKKANLWSIPADWRVITTNGFVKTNGQCVMGRGCAHEAARLYPQLPRELGKLIQMCGNRCYIFDEYRLITLPVKHVWWEEADVYLIVKSMKQFVRMVDKRKSVKRVAMPRPGCGNGRLQWDDVRPLIEPLLDDRFTVCHF